MDCIFCKIIKGEIPSNKVYEDAYTLAFHDLNPLAPVHVLVVPKTHIDSLDKVVEESRETMSHVLAAIPKIAKTLGLVNGYRVITNIGEDGRQSVKHLHLHLLGGKQLPDSLI